MTAWWESLSQLNQFFYGLAMFVSVFFLWQVIAVFIGLGGDDADAGADADADAGVDTDTDVGTDTDGTYHEFEEGAAQDAHETATAFRLLSLRSIITCATLFSWGTALYMNRGHSLAGSLGLGIVWGLVGMFCVAGLFYIMRRLTETGTKDLATSIGNTGTVYLDIPAGGTGEVRVAVSGIVSFVKARAAGGEAVKAGTPIRVRRHLDQSTLEVEPTD